MSNTLTDRDLRSWLRDQRPELDTSRLNSQQLRSTARAVVALDTDSPTLRNQALRLLAAEFPAPSDPAQASQPFTHFRRTPPIRYAGESYRVADPRHYADHCPDLDLSGNTVYATNDPPPGHPGSTTWLDQSGEQPGGHQADRQSEQ